MRKREGRKSRIKYKVLCDAQERGDLQLPSIELYYDACCLMRIRDWIKFNNPKLLALEGFNIVFSWHVYLVYGKVKQDRMFKLDIIRSSLLQTWKKDLDFLPQQRPPWIVPQEVIQFVAGIKEKEPHTYGDLIKFED